MAGSGDRGSLLCTVPGATQERGHSSSPPAMPLLSCWAWGSLRPSPHAGGIRAWSVVGAPWESVVRLDGGARSSVAACYFPHLTLPLLHSMTPLFVPGAWDGSWETSVALPHPQPVTQASSWPHQVWLDFLTVVCRRVLSAHLQGNSVKGHCWVFSSLLCWTHRAWLSQGWLAWPGQSRCPVSKGLVCWVEGPGKVAGGPGSAGAGGWGRSA